MTALRTSTRSIPAPRETFTGPEVLALLAPRRSSHNVDRSEQGKAARTYRGCIYDSLAEAQHAAWLDIRVKCGEIRRWWRQVGFPLVVNGSVIGKMTIDFKIEDMDGTIRYQEFKGHETSTFKLRLKILRAIYPDLLLEIVRAK